MKLIVGLGNPGKEYLGTRHNTGFLVLDNYANLKNVEISKLKFGGLYGKLNVDGEDVILLKPQSYINLSGEVIKKYLDYFKIDIDDILIVSDDLDMDVGKIKLKYKGSSGGHNGLKNIEVNLGTPVYKRLKVGISNNKDIDTKDYVLGKFTKDEMEIVKNMLNTTNNILDGFIKEDFAVLMSKYN